MNNGLPIKRPLQFSYLILTCLFVLLIVADFLFLRNDYFNARGVEPVAQITNYSHEWQEDDNLPAGGMDVVSWTLESNNVNLEELTFYTIHKYVRIYVGEELIYSVFPSDNNFAGRTAGNRWNYIRLEKNDVGKTIKIDLIPVYKSNIGSLPEFYIGDKWEVLHNYLTGNFWIFIMGVASIMVGGIFHIWIFVNRKRQGIDNSTLHIGTFAILIGLWEVTDINTAGLFISNEIALAALPIISLFLATIPVLMFIRDFFKRRRERYYNIILGLAITACYAVLWLQIFEIWDLRQSLPICHVIFIVLIASTIWDMIMEIKISGWIKKLKVAVFSLATSFLGLIVDLVVYYKFDGKVSTGLGMLGFLAYIIVMGIFMITDTMDLIERGRQAGVYREMAYKDALTGCLSRAAYMDTISSEDFKDEDMSVVILDINNLKTCNDTRGHEAGDELIKSSAQIIMKAVGDLGKCYRIGGDEFCVLMDSVTEADCEKALERLEKAEWLYNSENTDRFSIEIAAGYAFFNDEKDYDITDTVRRADKYMYINKMEIKGEVKNGANNK